MGSISPEEAKLRFKTPWIETPLVESASLSRAAGCRIFLKLENVQPSGSFKSRAMGNQILSHLVKPENVGRPVHFYASSGGNAGLAAVCAARSLGYPCTVVVPLSTKPLMVNKLRAAGASDIIQHGETFSEAGEYMREVIMKGGDSDAKMDVVKIALHPFDNEPIWEGNSTIVDELATQLPPVSTREEAIAYNGRALPLDAVICSVGGGGLLNGLVMGLERRRQIQKQSSHYSSSSTTTTTTVFQQDPVHLLAIETDGTDSLALAIAQKSLVSLPKITSQATSLGAIRVSERTFKYAISPPPGIAVHSAVLSDADAARGVLRLADDERLLVELACGVCVEAAIGDAAKARGAASTPALSASEQPSVAGKKRKRTQTEYCHRDEGYGDDRLSSGENEAVSDETGNRPPAQANQSSASPGEFQSKLKQLVPNLQADSRVVIIVCGGSNVTIDMAGEWRKMLQEGWGR
ncbi:putative L-serine dehydratase [Aspergillus clavatus NRRL 1]|uniref:L-serine ammonia-lyase n=1 Tax=Aspergillus clavatus (strain ATCC 1007 / CBS 513.65 / DSM 816 / NCTC 3887 / NRRL 1 / QM 1276 / 107) TaxID=344612 RepID=A1CH94_ASPCL|nr:l-serine dehydratase [Aspergillus clavatus NRRL 1]EAW10249.1 l-serine dehydratase [Aspergillus clavatus NRRL 1]